MLPLSMLELRYYLASDGRSPFEDWFSNLNAAAAAKVAVGAKHRQDEEIGAAKDIGRTTGGDGSSEPGGSRSTHRSDREPPGSPERAAREMREDKMGVTKSFKALVQRRVVAEPAFAEALLREGIDTMLSGDVDTGKSILRDYIKATVGFEKLGEATDTPPKSLIRMFSARGNPQARNLFSVIGYLQKQAGVEFHVEPAPR